MCDLSPKAECLPDFRSESKRGAFVREAENRDEKWFEMELAAVTFGRYLRERFLTKKRTLQGGFLSDESRSILVQIKGRSRKRPQPRPQSPAVRGFPRF